MPKKLIEVALPLEAINAQSAREKSIRHGHPSTLHLWWARRPLAAARAVIWASLVDDPSGHPEEFPNEDEQNRERQRLFRILEELVVWENSNNERVLDAAKKEIMKSTGGNPPELLDPFAGGGSIPLEAQRLGLVAHAHDLNPVAVMINKAMIEIPPRFAGRPPVNPEYREVFDLLEWTGAQGLAEDVRYYGEWMKQKAWKKIGHLYPKVKVPKEQGGGEATVIAWIWARTVKCPNPVCGCEMPLVRSFTLSKKKGHEAWVEPIFGHGEVRYQVHNEGAPSLDGTVVRTGASCACCGDSVSFDYVRNEARNHRMGSALMAIVADGKNGRLYLSPTNEQVITAEVPFPEDVPNTALPEKALGFRVQGYGMTHHKDLFTNRQLTALTTFSGLVAEAQRQAQADALTAGLPDDDTPLADGGTGARAYGEAVGVYLAFVVDKMADYHSGVCSWHNSGEKIRNTFGRQAIPMVWDYAEANPFCKSSGSYVNMLDWVYRCIEEFPATSKAEVSQFDAQSDCSLRNIMVSSDPPYYDNIGYADLSDFFYVWMRQSLKNTYPQLFQTMLVPKTDELIANPFRFDSNADKARNYFESGMLETCQQIYKYAREDIPVTIYYAYKQSDTDEVEEGKRTASTGWETMISAIIQAGFSITGTWPMRTELANRNRSIGSNALASSIVLACRKRPADARTCSRRDFVSALKRELKPALQTLQASNIAPVDLAQAAIGPGMGIYSRFAKVLDAGGSPMSVRSALQLINQEVDSYFNDQDSALDRESRLCLELFTQAAFNTMKFGDADILARAKNTSVQRLEQAGVVSADKGSVRLLERKELPPPHRDSEKVVWLLCQQLTYAMETGGISACAQAAALVSPISSALEDAKNLAYRLYSFCERKDWAKEAGAYNALVTDWPEIMRATDDLRHNAPAEQMHF